MKTGNRDTGRLGESLAAEFLTKKGLTIVEKNYSSRFGEIDLIVLDKEILVFVEVKTKKGTDFGLPEEMVSKGKIQKVRNMATMYLNGASIPCRIDVVAIILDQSNQIISIKHYENVY